MCTSSIVRLASLAFFVLASVIAHVEGGYGSSEALNQHCCFVRSPLPSPREYRTRRQVQDADHNTHDEYDPVIDWKPPSADMIQKTREELIRPLQRLVSPIFFSTDRHGKRYRGLSKLPNKRPLLIVGNHQLGGFDMILVGSQLVEERNLFVRGLGHPVIFQDVNLGGGPSFLPKSPGSSTFDLYKTFGGAVLATPKNFYRLMQTQQAVLHFPGGAREAYHGKGEAYSLFWPNQTDFVRTAAKFNATVVPLSSIGAADSVYILADPDTLLNLPILGDYVAKSFFTVQEAARYDNTGPYIRPPPLIWPKLLPARHYFCFGKPFDLSGLDSRDKDGCQRVYQAIQTELMRGFTDLLRAREKDPFKDSKVRFVYEQVTGKAAPTFSVEELTLKP